MTLNHKLVEENRRLKKRVIELEKIYDNLRKEYQKY